MRNNLIVLTGILLALAGCADADKTDATAPSAAASIDPDTRNLKFAECMRENGVDVPDPKPGEGMRLKFGPESGGQEKVQAAMEACREWAPTGVNGGGPGADPQQAEKMRAYAQCMRDNGVESFPDPEDGMMRIDATTGEDPDFEAAEQKCGSVLR
ncbi:hypothetical protein AB0M02_41310 [Actinoplanes sp. NPDC051861]|uniref:hypothetical protein n=1 Tax=Actinoplanes sp. NPDC051861 TaxID=3155170 RepID=UPI00343DF7C5